MEDDAASGLPVRTTSLEEGLACREATTDPKLMIFAIHDGSAKVPILVAIGTEEGVPIGRRGQA